MEMKYFWLAIFVAGLLWGILSRPRAERVRDNRKEFKQAKIGTLPKVFRAIGSPFQWVVMAILLLLAWQQGAFESVEARWWFMILVAIALPVLGIAFLGKVLGQAAKGSSGAKQERDSKNSGQSK